MASRRAPLTRSTRSSLRIDPASCHESDTSGSPSPGVAAASQSPDTPLNSNRPSPSDSDSIDDEKDKEPASGPKRSNSSTSINSKGEKERRKRSRVTAEQLVHLEQFFAVERSPTAARRREISEMLGMEERQTQVWFQNRRAKAKMLQTKNKDPIQAVSHYPVPQRQADIIVPESPPKLLTGFQADLERLIHENEPITIIPCTNLSIGTWRRIASSVSEHDLVAYVCESKQTLAWFISSNGCGFKMEIHFDTIVESEFTNAGPGSGLASFALSRPPTFFLEHTGSAFNEEPRRRAWSQSADWTEAYQATNVLRHEIIGSAMQLSHLVQALQNRTQTSVIYLHTPAYKGAAPAEIPRPSMGSLTDPQAVYSYAGSGQQSADYQAPSFTGAPTMPPTSMGYAPKPVNTVVPAVAFTPPTFSTLTTACGDPDSSSFGSSYAEYQYTAGHQMVTESTNDYGQNMSRGVPSTHTGPYLAQPVPRAFYREHTQFESSYQVEGTASGYRVSAPVDQYVPTSPPLLTTPFYPPTSITQTYSDGQGAVTPGMPAIKYEVNGGSLLH